jgi:hypothetical protein
MSDYRNRAGKVFSEDILREKATAGGMIFEEYLQLGGFELYTKEGKQTGTTKKAVVDVPSNLTAGTGSPLDDISSGSPKPDPFSKFYVTPEDLKDVEETVAPNLQKKLARLGITTEEGTTLGSLDAISLKRGVFDPVEIAPIPVGKNKTEEELQNSAKEINSYIKKYGNLSFLEESKNDSFKEYESYSGYTKAPDIEEEELKNNYKKDLDLKFKKIKQSKTKATGQGGRFKEVEPVTIQDFESEKEYNLYKEWDESGQIKEPNESQLLEYDYGRKQAYALKKSSEFVSDLDPLKRIQILALASEDEEKVKEFRTEFKNFEDSKRKLDLALSDLQEEGGVENYNKAYNLQIDFLNKQNSIQDLQQKAIESGLVKREEALPLAISDFNKNYDRLEQTMTAFKSTATGVLFGALQLLEMRHNPSAALVSPASRNEMLEDKYGIVSLGAALEKETENYQRAIQVDEIRSVKDAGRWVAGSVPNLVPSLAMAKAGPMALPLFFLSAFGDKGLQKAIEQKEAAENLTKYKAMLDNNPEMDYFEKLAVEGEIEKAAKILSIKNWEALTSQAINGLAEVVFEKVGTLAILKGLKNGIKGLPPRTIKEGFKFAGKEVGKAYFREGFSEFGTTVVQNWGDIYVLGEDKNLFEGGLESFAQGGLMGGGLGAVSAGRGFKQAVISSIADTKEMQSLKDITKDLRKITGIKDLQGPSSLDGVELNIPSEAKEIVNRLVKKGKELEQGVLYKLGTSLPIETAYKVEEINRKMRKLNKSLISAYSNPNIKASELTNIESQLRKEYQELDSAREGLLTDTKNAKEAKAKNTESRVAFDNTFGYRVFEQSILNKSTSKIEQDFVNLTTDAKQAETDKAKKDLLEEGIANPSEKQIETKARNNYVNDAYKIKIKNGQVNAEQFAKDQKLDVDFIVLEGKNAAENTIKAFEDNAPDQLNKVIYTNKKGQKITLKQAIKNGSYEGGAISGTNKIIINLESSAANKRIGVFSHEVLHKYAEVYFGQNQNSIDLAGKNLLDYLSKNQPDLYARVKFRINKSYTSKGVEGELVKQKDYYEEAMNAMSDVLADGETVSESTISQMRVFVNNFLPKKFQFKKEDGSSVYHFVKNYNKSSHFGGKASFESVINPVVSDDEKAKVSLSITKINEQIQALEDQYESGEIDYDDYDQQLSNLEAKLERVKTVPTEEVKTTKPKEDKREVKQLGDALNKLIPEGTTNKEYKERVVGTVAAELSGKTLNPLIKKIAAGYGIVADNVYGKSWEDFYIAVKGVQFIKNLQKFNPEINDNFGGFVIGSQYGVRNRVKEALIKFKKENEGGFKEDVSIAKGIAAEETTAPEAAEKAKYKNLLQQKVLSTEGLKTARTKVISSVRVLKSKIDAAVTKNVAVTPIIEEIRVSVGKQLDIIFKKEMGGKPKEKFKNYLLTNKKAILENLTTTYLLRAMPQTIQKSVGGKYLLNKDGSKVINSFGDTTFSPNFVNYDVWKNGKVDREKTSTEAAGRTSGNEITRRMPKISENISDQEFLDMYLNEDGSLIKGRKESLAKALGEEVAFDMIKQDLQTGGPISEALVNNQEALGVVIKDNFVEDMTRQMERGNIKLSVSQDIQDGVSILVQNKFDQSSDPFVEWRDNLSEETRKEWDEYWSIPFNKISAGVRTIFANPKYEKEISKFKEFEEYFDIYAATPTNNEAGNEISMEQLAEFTEKLAEVLPSNFFKALGLARATENAFLGFHSRYIKSGSELRKKIKTALSKKASDPAFDALLEVKNDIFIASPKNTLYKQILQWQAESTGTAEQKAKEFVEKFGEKLQKAQKANAVLFEYFNSKAFEILSKNEALIPGYLRWLETNTNISESLKSLAIPTGIQLFEGDQATFVDEQGKKYYGKPTNKKVVLNKNHVQYNEARREAVKAAHKAWDALSKPKKVLEKSKTIFTNKRLKSTTVGIEAFLRPKGEHQKSVGGATINIAKNTFSMLSLAKQNPDATQSITSLLNILNSEILLDFTQTINAKYVSDIQDQVLGETSPLLEGRLEALDSKNKESIYFYDGKTGAERAAKAINKVVNNLDPEAVAKNMQALGQFKREAVDPSIKLSLSKDLNDMIERGKGVSSETEFSKIVAKRMGANIGKYKVYLPSSAEDFRLLTSYTFAGKGKQGEKDMQWFEENLIRPYTEAINAIDTAKQTTKNDFKALNKAMPDVAKSIGGLIPSKDYTNDQAVRVYLWNKSGYSIPGLDKKEIGKLIAHVTGNLELQAYANSLLVISKNEKWTKPGEHWDVETILSDINNLTEKGGRKAYLAKWIKNVDEIFSETNLNKIEALYGKKHREALEDTLYRMKNGTNRPSGANAQVNKWNNWLNNSIGSIMFFNRRSAIMQLLSTVNFVNWSDNNPVNAAKAFANQKQYWSDFSYIFNSDKLKQRRGGLRADVNEAEIASAAANSRNKAQAALSWLLKKGFTPTQIADSFAIASGGATFYRNRINTYLKQGLDTKEAEKKAWLDFIEISDQAQQSGDPSLVSMEQASILGRLVLAFQNTTQQYSRLMKRSGLDLINRRQMPGTSSMLQSDFANISKILYYGAIQNVIFSALSASLFALLPGFDDNEEDESDAQKAKEKKIAYMFNGTVDSLLRGMGVKGSVISTIKNVIMEYYKQAEKGFTGDQTYTIIQAVNLSPPIGSKVKKMYSAIKGYEYEKDVIKERGFDVTANGRVNLSPSYRVFGTLASGTVNLPVDRMYTEIQGMSEMLDDRNTIYQRLALALGWRTWDVNAKNEEDDLIKAESSAIRIKQGREKAKAKRELKKQELIEARKKAFNSMSPDAQIMLMNLSKNKRKKILDKRIKDMK